MNRGVAAGLVEFFVGDNGWVDAEKDVLSKGT